MRRPGGDHVALPLVELGTPNWFAFGVLVADAVVMVRLAPTRRSGLDDAGRVFVEADEMPALAPATAPG